MSRRRPAAFAAALAALAGAATAEAAPPARPPPPPFATRPAAGTAPGPAEAAVAAPAESAGAPRPPAVATPPPLAPGAPSENLSWSYEVEGLSVLAADGDPPERSAQFRREQRALARRAKGRRRAPRDVAAETAWVRLLGAGAQTLVAFAWQAAESNYARALSVPCRPWLEAPARWPLRWETLGGGDDGAPVWQVSDGFYDERTCRLSVARRARLRPAVLARRGDAPALLAAREGGAITLLLPPTRSLQAHDLAGALRASLDPFARVVVPSGPGLAATVVASFAPSSLASWWQRFPSAAPPVLVRPPRLPAPGPLELRVDVSQAVAERAPTVAVRWLGDEAEGPAEAARPSLGASPAPSGVAPVPLQAPR